MMHKIFTPNKFCHNLLRPFEVLTSSVVTSCMPGEALKKTTFFCFVLWILEMVQLLAGQCCLQVSASTKQVKLQPPPVQFCWQFKPWHSNEQFPELHSWTHDGESHIPLHPPSGHRCMHWSLALQVMSQFPPSVHRCWHVLESHDCWHFPSRPHDCSHLSPVVQFCLQLPLQLW